MSAGSRSSGRPCRVSEFRIVDPETRADLPERDVGELLIRGTSVTPGYYKRPDATAALFHEGWLCTGDLAYLIDGELVLCGRIKDVIIVGGRNVFPEDIERAVGGLEGVRAGNVIAFGVEGYKGKESVVVVAEARTDDPDSVRHAIHSNAPRRVRPPASRHHPGAAGHAARRPRAASSSGPSAASSTSPRNSRCSPDACSPGCVLRLEVCSVPVVWPGFPPAPRTHPLGVCAVPVVWPGFPPVPARTCRPARARGASAGSGRLEGRDDAVPARSES